MKVRDDLMQAKLCGIKILQELLPIAELELKRQAKLCHVVKGEPMTSSALAVEYRRIEKRISEANNAAKILAEI